MKQQNALVLGNETREQAIVEALLRSEQVKEVFWYPGNGITGIVGSHPKMRPGLVPDITNPWAMLGLAQYLKAGLTIMGPELPLTFGIADVFALADVPFLGATRFAAQLESSKAWAKQFMTRYNIPTASYDVCETVAEAGAAVIKRNGICAVKGDGLAGGKAVYICNTLQEAMAAIKELMIAKMHGESCSRVVVEDLLFGDEVSFFALPDGRTVVEFDSAGDHKREFDGDKGRNADGDPKN